MGMHSLMRLIKAVGIAYGAVFLLLLGGNAVALQQTDPMACLDIIAGTVFILGALLAGLLNARLGGGGFPGGLAAGGVYIGFIGLFSLFVEGSDGLVMRLMMNTGALAASSLAGWMGTKHKPKKISPAKSRANARRRLNARA